MKYIIFGAGQIGLETYEILDANEVSFFIDNDINKINTEINDKIIYSLKKGLEKRNGELIVVAVSKVYEQELITQLEQNNIKDFCTSSELKMNITKERILNRPDYIGVYNKAIQWIKKNSVIDGGIINNSKLRISYPEVTGYYIPTLLRWGYRDIAVSYARWLCEIQKKDGSWYDTLDEFPYIFDTAQILKGLLSIREIYPQSNQIDKVITSGCDWMLSCMTEEGQLKTPNKSAWGDIATELIHTYCLSPLMEASKVYDCIKYEKAAQKVLSYYKENFYQDIVNFSMLSHFYAYIVEAMLDMGEIDIAKEAMKNIESYQKDSGAVPAYKDVDWVCSTGLFQLSLIWFRLGDWDRGNRAFQYACKLQNETGGWYGSYISEENENESNTYFPNAEISWAIKYFLDALYYRNLCQFEMQAHTFRNDLLDEDKKYLIINDIVGNMQGTHKKVLDVGCGKGRYIRKIQRKNPKNQYYAVDISDNVMQYFNDCENIEKKQGSLTDIPYEDNIFDVVYTCEALEHAVDIKSAVKEMARVTVSNGKLIIIDKNKSMYGFFEIEEWEQWFDSEDLRIIMLEYCKDVKYINDIDYDGHESDGLFGAWIGTVK